MKTDLVILAQHGDKGAFALIAAEIADRFLAMSRRILRDVDLAPPNFEGPTRPIDPYRTKAPI